MSSASLPRRLRAERDCVELLGKGCCVVDLAGCERYAIVISSQGVAAIVGDVADDTLKVDADAADGATLPAFAIGTRSDGTQVWLEYVSGSGGTYERCRPPRADDVRRGAAKAEGKWPAVIVASIARYYGLQALEPSVRGFLAILEKQFDRADAYVWELLQNGVDDGATQVVVERLPERRGVRVSHDGRRFTPLDVLGLSSVGLSTKSLLSDGNAPRSIGFMGIGFKAVYRRFKRVTVSDGRWRFRYDEPRDRAPGEPKHAWVLRPAPLELDGESKWCAFDLERPRQSVEADLRPPNASAVAMVGRAAAHRSGKTWTLDWDGRRHAVALATKNDEETITVDVAKGDRSNTRTFVAFVHGWRPRGAAKEAYEAHTKRAHDGNAEELRLFFEVGADEQRPGLIHCTLPTRVRAPTGKGTHLDGPFLLSVDRGSLDGTHAWNAALLQHGLGELLVKLLRWAARACRDADDKAKVLRDAFSRLPPLTRDADGKLSTTVAGASVSLHALDSALRRESLLPCLPLGTFRTAREARWVPPAFGERVPAPVLKELFGGAPLATHLLGDAFADKGTWAGVVAAPAPRRGVRVDARLVGACGVDASSVGAALLEAAAATPELDEGWQCILSASTEVVAPGRCRFLDDDVASLPEALRGALEAAASRAVDGNGKDAPRLAHQGAMASPLSRGAQGFLAALRKGRDKVVTVARAAHAAQKGWGSGDAALFVALAAWAKDARKPEALSMALDDRREPKPIHTLSLGASYGDDVSAVAAPAQRRVSECYLEQGGSSRGWADFWRSAGACDGQVRVETTVSRVDSRKAAQLVTQAVASADARPHLREVKFRKSAPSTAVPLPYGLLNEMDKRYAYVVDCRLARAWGATPADADAARAFAKALARRPIESVDVPSAKTVPAARRTFGDSKAPDSLCDGISPRDAAPLRRRLYWLPPGQAAACAVDLGPAAWVDELSRKRWVPCAWPGGPACVERPSHVALKKEEDGRRPLIDFGSDDAIIRRALCLSTSPWASRLAWASEAPPPPLDALLELMKSDAPADVDALTAAWLRVGRGASELDRQGTRDLASAARRSHKALPSSGSAVLPLDRCVVVAGDPDDLTRALVGVGFLADVKCGPLAAVAEALGTLLRLAPAASRDHALRYLRRLGDAAPERLAVPELDALSEATAAAARRGLDAKLPCRKLDGTGALVWLRGSDAIVVDDDGRDGARRHCLRASLGYLPLALFERDRRRAASVADALGLPRLSKWPLRTTATGTVSRLEEASTRFALVLRLLGDASDAPGVYRRGGLKRELTAPNGRTAASQLHALWGRVRGVEGAQLLVAGDSDDYAPAAEELALGRANVTFADARIRDILRLLGALEDERRFVKLSGRLVTSDDRRVVGAFQADAALEVADTADDVASALREHGAVASAAAIDRATAKGAALRAADAEVKRKRDEEREDQKKKRKLLADADSLLSAVRAEAAAESEDEAEAEAQAQAQAVVNNGAAPALNGRGRGVSNLPAWMTGGVSAPPEPAAPEPEPEPAPPPAVLNGGAAPVLAGRGRGVSNLPAWMTGGAAAAPEPSGEKRGRDGEELPDAKRPAPDAHADLHASMLHVARTDPDAFDSLVADVWQQVGKN